MRELKLTQEKLAERVGVTQGAVGLWLRGERELTLKRMNQILVAIELPHMQMTATSMLAEEPANYGLPTTFRYPLSDWQRLAAIAEDAPGAQEITDYKALGTAFWLRVEGDAMTAPTGLSISAGMLVLVDTGVEVQVGRLVIARVPGNSLGLLRQLVVEGGQRFLKPLNPSYPITLCGEDCELLGVAIQAGIRF
ncbi:LexA family protein [Pseudomonas sp. zfem002]|uniref:LexA family protein n=1 Tax=Pseudomonas sp. zfem002 TaxID=3078197 RepID=UPI0029284B6A|nr:S24 family peptidase [Pseudomonas sp. zfem002]MDU9393994.1 S24 family peptidase [Pseudomonas sp. zfem002]